MSKNRDEGKYSKFCTLYDMITMHDPDLSQKISALCMTGIFTRTNKRYTFFAPEKSAWKKIKDDDALKEQIKAHIIRKAFSVEQLENIIDKAHGEGQKPTVYNMLSDAFEIGKSSKKNSIVVNGLTATHVDSIFGRGQLYKIDGLLPVKKASAREQKGTGDTTWDYNHNDLSMYGEGNLAGAGFIHTVFRSGMPLRLSLGDNIVREYVKAWQSMARYKGYTTPHVYLCDSLLNFIARYKNDVIPTFAGMMVPYPSYTYQAYQLMHLLPHEMLMEFKSSPMYLRDEPLIQVKHDELLYKFSYPSIISRGFMGGGDKRSCPMAGMGNIGVDRPLFSGGNMGARLAGIHDRMVRDYYQLVKAYDTGDMPQVASKYSDIIGKGVYEFLCELETLTGKKYVYRRIHPDVGYYLKGNFAANTLLRMLEQKNLYAASMLAETVGPIETYGMTTGPVATFGLTPTGGSYSEFIDRLIENKMVIGALREYIDQIGRYLREGGVEGAVAISLTR